MWTSGARQVLAKTEPGYRPYTIKGLADEEGISKQAVWCAIRDGRLFAYRYTPRGQWLIPPQEVARIRRGEEGALADAD
jgi:hypothetical protein